MIFSARGNPAMKALARLHISAVSPQPSMVANTSMEVDDDLV